MKYIITGFLVGCIFAINSLMIGIGGMTGYYLAGGSIVDYLGRFMGESGIILVIIVPLVLWTFIGYIVSRLRK